MYVQCAMIESFILEQIGGGGMEDSNLKLCDNLVWGGVFAYTLSVSLKRKERKGI